MFPLLKRRERKRAVGWGDELIIRPDTPLSAAQKKQLAKAIRRAKRDGKIAATAQQTIPYEEMYENGVCSLGNRLYSKSIAFEDRSYAEASDDDKAVIFELYCRLVNYFGPTVGFQLSVVCYYPDMVEYRKILRIPPTGDSFDPIRKEFSDMLLTKASLCKTERSLCLTFTVEAEDVKQATSRLEQIEADVLERFKGIGTQAHGMDGYERLLLLHHCYTWMNRRNSNSTGTRWWEPVFPVRTTLLPAPSYLRKAGTSALARRSARFPFCRSRPPNCMTRC